jgi:tetratricopeptide (TPR) repeat protein
MRIGDVCAGRFELTRFAGAGGMARVYRAIDRKTGASVALKILHADEADDIGRFAREAELLAELHHPGIVRYVAHGTNAEGACWLAMEWLEGEDLGERLRNGRLFVGQAMSLCRRVGEALGAAHARGIVHRDIKPSNLFLPHDGDVERVRLLDFGIARAAHVSRRLTKSGMTMGTPGYMSPEQARGEGEADPRTDVFALGCVLYECLSGEPAFEAGHAVAVLSRVLFDEPPPLRELCPEASPELCQLVAAMLAKEAPRRPADGRAVAEALARLAAPHEARAPETAAPRSLGHAEQRVVSVVVAAPARAPQPTTPWTAFGEREGEPLPIEPLPAPAPTVRQAGPPTDMTRAADNRLARASLDELRQVARPWGARVEMLADGTVVAVLPGTLEVADEAVRAARCALALRARMPGVPLALATGRGVVDDRYPVGEVMERAVRALLRAPPDAVAVDEGTAALLEMRFDVWTPPGESALAGAVLRGERSEVRTDHRLLGKPVPCVGRERELGMLIAAWNECVAEPAAAAVLITGEAGVGKSRLVAELTARIQAGETGRMRVVLARADPASAGSAYGMIAPGTRRLAGILDGEPPEVSRLKLQALVAARVPAERVAMVATFVGEMVGIPCAEAPDTRDPAARRAWEALRAAQSDALTMGDQMRAAWLEWVTAVASSEPFLVVLEDLHWGDLPTVELVDAALKRLRDAPLMIVAIGRPEVHQRFPRLWQTRNVVSLPLSGLSARASERLVKSALGDDIGQSRAAAIAARADGNALHLEELIRAEAARAEGGGEGEGERDDAALPPTVLGMMQARFDALPGEARRALRAASIFGRVFWRGGVAALLGPERGAVAAEEWLDELAARELVAAEPGAPFSDEQQYAFRHDLVRDAAYAMLTPADRTLGHHLAGEWLEQRGERDPVLLAQHFEQGAEGARAASRWLEAGVEAFEAGDLAAAVARVQRGVTCGAGGELYGMLRLVEGEARGWMGDLAGALPPAAEAPAHLPEGTASWFRAAGELVYASAPLGKHADVLAWADRLEATAPGDDAAAAARVGALCRALIQLELIGRHARAVTLLDVADRAAGALRAGGPMVEARLHQARGFVLVAADDPLGSLRAHRASADAFARSGASRLRSGALTHGSFVLLEVGLWGDAERDLVEAIDIAQRAGIRAGLAMARTNLTMALMRQGRLGDAAASGSHAVEAASGFADARVAAVSRGYLAEVLAAGDDLGGAEREARQAVAAAEALPAFTARAYGALARVLSMAGRHREALDATSAAVAIVDRLGAVLGGESLLRLEHVRALQACGEHEAAAAARALARARIRARAAAIGDAEVRERFLREVPENAATLRDDTDARIA